MLHTTREWVLALACLTLMLASSEVGFRVGRKPGKQISDSTKSQISTVEAGILGVLAMLLGFTVSMAVTRFEARKQLVLEEANAIATAYLRAQMLPLAECTDIADLLREYANIRVPRDDGLDIYEQTVAARQESARLQGAFWQRAVAFGQKDPIRAGALLQSLNEVISIDEARWTAFENHVPETVIYVIAVVGSLAMMIVGYTFGLGGLRQLFSICTLSVAISLVLVVIIDLDRPHEGFIHVSQQPLVDLQKRLHRQ